LILGIMSGFNTVDDAKKFLEGIISSQTVTRKFKKKAKVNGKVTYVELTEELNLVADVACGKDRFGKPRYDPTAGGYLAASLWVVDPRIGSGVLSWACGCSMQMDHIAQYEIFDKNGRIVIRGPNPNTNVLGVRQVHNALSEMGYVMGLNRFYTRLEEQVNDEQTKRPA
jgi:hypothetical protein